ncbi:MAG: hypothetical protein F9K32_16675 [Desulfobulbaceae bacterium]|nr:MAG: hypothetical protein F9K32_16675 [Desulfobulbaceae bacterium]
MSTSAKRIADIERRLAALESAMGALALDQAEQEGRHDEHERPPVHDGRHVGAATPPASPPTVSQSSSELD